MQREGQRSRQAPKPVQHLGRLAPKDKAPQASPGEQAVLPGPRDGLIPRGVFLSGTAPPAPQRQSQLLPGEGPVREKPAVSPALHQSPAGAPVRRLPVIGAGGLHPGKSPAGPGGAPRRPVKHRGQHSPGHGPAGAKPGDGHPQKPAPAAAADNGVSKGAFSNVGKRRALAGSRRFSPVHGPSPLWDIPHLFRLLYL